LVRGLTIDSKKRVYAAVPFNIAIISNIYSDHPVSKRQFILPGNLWDIYKENDSILWVTGNINHLVKYNTITKKISPFETFRRLDNTIKKYDENRLIIGGESGLIIFNKKTELFNDLFKDFNNLQHTGVTDVLISKETLWVATYADGLYCLDRNFKIIRKYSQDALNWNISSNQILDLHLADDKLYVGTTRGLDIIDLRSNKLEFNLNTKNGLPDNRVASIIETEKDFWLGTFKGLVRLSKKNNQISIYNKSDGLLSDDFNKKSFFKLSDSLIALGTTKGIIVFNPDKIPEKKVEKEIRLIQSNYYDLDQANFITKSYGLDSLSKIKVPYDQNFISLSFGIQGDRNESIVYQLGDKSSQWIYANNKNEIVLSNLSPGEYTLHVKAQGEESLVDGKIKTYSIIVYKSIFYRTWFITLVIMSFIVVCVIFYFYSKTKNLKEKNLQLATEKLKDKAYKAQMNPHFMFNVVNNLRSISLLKQKEEVDKYIQVFARLLRRTLYMSDQDMIPLKDEIEYIKSYIDLQIMRKDLQIDTSIGFTDGDINNIIIPPMLFQPIVENAIEKGLTPKKGEKRLALNFVLKGNDLIATVEDNGIGIKESLKRKEKIKGYKSFGQSILNERIKIHNQTQKSNIYMNIEDKVTGGVKAEIIIKNVNKLEYGETI
jgi:two-component sensor histidine kinase